MKSQPTHQRRLVFNILTAAAARGLIVKSIAQDKIVADIMDIFGNAHALQTEYVETAVKAYMRGEQI